MNALQLFGDDTLIFCSSNTTTFSSCFLSSIFCHYSQEYQSTFGSFHVKLRIFLSFFFPISFTMENGNQPTIRKGCTIQQKKRKNRKTRRNFWVDFFTRRFASWYTEENGEVGVNLVSFFFLIPRTHFSSRIRAKSQIHASSQIICT